MLVARRLPALFVLVAAVVANRAFTGEWSANGAIVKLAINNPYMTADEKLADYVFNLRYAAPPQRRVPLRRHRRRLDQRLRRRLAGAPPPLVYLAKTAWWAA